jgi:hypothetical protein
MPRNAENMAEIPDSSDDLVLVQDGLHLVPRPVNRLGNTMVAVVVKADGDPAHRSGR